MPLTDSRRSASGALTAVLILIGAVSAGMRVPVEEWLDGSDAGSPLDYAALPGNVAPLDAGFVAEALGLSQPAAALTGGAPSAPAGPVHTGMEQAPASASPGREEVAHAPTNDDFADAYRVGSVPFTATTNASGSRESDEPASCGPAGATLWYRHTPRVSAGLVANTLGSTTPTALAVFVGDGLHGLEQVGCHTDLQGRAQVAFGAEAGTTYHFQVTVPTGRGSLVFNLDHLVVTERVSLTSDGRETYEAEPNGGHVRVHDRGRTACRPRATQPTGARRGQTGHLR